MAGQRETIRRSVVGGLLSVVVIALILLLTRSTDPSTEPNDAPLAAPQEPTTTTTIPPPRPVASSEGWRLAVQTTGALWDIDLETGEMATLVDPADDALPRGVDLVVIRSAGAAPEAGDALLIEPDGDEVGFGADLPGSRFPSAIEQNPAFALTPRPVAIVPMRSGQEVILRRAALDGSSYDDIPLPGCGVAHPIAAASSDRVFGVWCRDSDDLRLFHDSAAGIVEIRVNEIGADGLMPALLERGDKPLLIDPFGGVWGFSLFEQAFDDEERPIAGRDGTIPLAGDERILGIAAISTDFEHIVVGVSSGSDFDGSPTASRLAGFDPLGFTDGWSFEAPFALASLVGAPDGFVYGLGQDDDGGVLLLINPSSGSVEVLFTGLPVYEGRLMVLG